MPRNASGVYSLPALNPVVAGTLITDTWANNTMADIANEVTNSLDRSGRGSMLAPFKLTDGVVGAPAFAFNNEPTTGFWRSGTAELNVAIAGVTAGKFTSAGWVGGHTGASSLNVLKAGDTMSGTLFSTVSEAFRVNNDTGYFAVHNTANNLRTGYMQFNTAAQIVYAAENGAYPIWLVGGTEAMRIGTSANLGLGVTPLTSNAGYRSIDVGHIGSAIFGGQGDLNMLSGTYYTPANYRNAVGSMAAAVLSVNTVSMGGALVFSNAPAAAAGSVATMVERFRITSAGDVGIGTSTPQGKLSVLTATVNPNGTSTWTNAYATFGPSVASATGSAFGIGYDTTGDQSVLFSLSPGIAWRKLRINCAGIEYWSNSGAFAWQMKITGELEDGNGIGVREIPRTAVSLIRGQTFAATAGFAIGTTGTAAGHVFHAYNDSAAAITITQSGGLTLRLAGTTSTGNRTLAPRGFATFWYNSATEAVVSGPGVT